MLPGKRLAIWASPGGMKEAEVRPGLFAITSIRPRDGRVRPARGARGHARAPGAREPGLPPLLRRRARPPELMVLADHGSGGSARLEVLFAPPLRPDRRRRPRHRPRLAFLGGCRWPPRRVPRGDRRQRPADPRPVARCRSHRPRAPGRPGGDGGRRGAGASPRAIDELACGRSPRPQPVPRTSLQREQEAEILRSPPRTPPAVSRAEWVALGARRRPRHIRRRKLTQFYQAACAVCSPATVSLPYLFDEDIGPSSIERLARRLEAA